MAICLQTLAEEDIALNKRIGLHGSSVVPQGANILHHCNTGTVATVQYGTAIGVRHRYPFTFSAHPTA